MGQRHARPDAGEQRHAEFQRRFNRLGTPLGTLLAVSEQYAQVQLARNRFYRPVHVRTVRIDRALHPRRRRGGRGRRWRGPCRARKGEAAWTQRGSCQDKSQRQELHHVSFSRPEQLVSQLSQEAWPTPTEKSVAQHVADAAGIVRRVRCGLKERPPHSATKSTVMYRSGF